MSDVLCQRNPGELFPRDAPASRSTLAALIWRELLLRREPCRPERNAGILHFVQDDNFVGSVQDDNFVGSVQDDNFVGSVLDENFVGSGRDENFVGAVQDDEFCR
jgi:hypothetical protein